MRGTLHLQFGGTQLPAAVSCSQMPLGQRESRRYEPALYKPGWQAVGLVS